MVSAETIAMDITKLKANAAYRQTKRAADIDKEIADIDYQKQCCTGVIVLYLLTMARLLEKKATGL